MKKVHVVFLAPPPALDYVERRNKYFVVFHIKTYVVKAQLWVFDLFNGSTENYQFRKTPKRTKKENSQAAKKNKNHKGKLPSQKGKFPSIKIIKI